MSLSSWIKAVCRPRGRPRTDEQKAADAASAVGGIVAGSAGNALRIAPLMAFVPITAMFSTLLSLNLIGDRLRAHFEVRESLL